MNYTRIPGSAYTPAAAENWNYEHQPACVCLNARCSVRIKSKLKIFEEGVGLWHHLRMKHEQICRRIALEA